MLTCLQVTIFSVQTGLPVKQITNSGSIISLAVADTPGQILVATAKDVTVWDYELTKIVVKHRFFKKDSKTTEPSAVVEDVLIPANFSTTGSLYITTPGKKRSKNLSRLDVFTSSCNLIFRDVSPGSRHLGDNNNTLVSLANQVKGPRNSEVVCYDRNLCLVQTYKADLARLFTIVRCHPSEKIVACGDTSGRVLILVGLGNTGDLRPAKSVLHWHSLPVTALAWSLEGQHLYSGGAERVLCKWCPDTNDKPSFLPRLNSEIVGIAVSEKGSVVSLADNSVLLLNSHDAPSGELVGLGLNSSGWPAGLAWDQRTKCLMMNGKVGHIQVFNPETKDTYSIDITQQNFLTAERDKKPFNAEVQQIAVSVCGSSLATLDTCLTPVRRILLKFWHFDVTHQKFVLNTQVVTPHTDGAHSLEFQPQEAGSTTPLLLTVGKDKATKVWTSKSSYWACLHSAVYRRLPCQTGRWSVDGSVFAVAFSHIVTLWNCEAELKAAITIPGSQAPIGNIEFGRGFECGTYLYATTDNLLCVWDLLSLRRVWSVELDEEPLTLASEAASGNLAVVTKNTISILDSREKAVLAKFDDVNATGGAVYGRLAGANVLYFLTYTGLIKTIGRKSMRPELIPESGKPERANQIANPLLSAQKKSAAPTEIMAETTSKADTDLMALLTVPLHAVPACSALAASFLSNRLAALPKLRTTPKIDENTNTSTLDDDQTVRKIKQIFSSQKPIPPLEFNAYCKLLKSKDE